MAFLVHPRYRHLLHQCGLATAEDILRLSGVIYGGHPHRHVARVTLGDGPNAIGAFLKKEHRVPLRDRWANAWAGFGFVSKSVREMKLLLSLAEEGLDAPEVLAAGESKGRAFLLLHEVEGAVDLRQFLVRHPSPRDRNAVLRQLARALARLHDAGFAHSDLYAKHVLVRREQSGYRLCVLDWQRSRRRGSISWDQRCRDLACLDATLAGSLASDRLRLAFLRQYVQRTRGAHPRKGCHERETQALARRIRELSRGLLQRRKIREQRQPPLKTGKQNLIWLDGEALCVTRQYLQQVEGHVPAWLRAPTKDDMAANAEETRTMVDAGGIVLRFVRRRSNGFWTWLTSKLRCRRFGSPELEQAAAIFRLERHGITCPRLLAVGQRCRRPWQIESFLLTEPVANVTPLCQWLAERGVRPVAHRRCVLRQTGALLRRLHEAGYGLDAQAASTAFGVRELPGQPPAVVVQNVVGLRRSRHLSRRRDLRLLFWRLAEIVSRRDTLLLQAAYRRGHRQRQPVQKRRQPKARQRQVLA